MKNFRRALKIASVHRMNMVAYVATSVVIALLWGGNLTVVGPLVDVVMNDQSMPQWIDQKVDESNREAADSAAWLTHLQSLKSDNPDEIRSLLNAEILKRQSELDEQIKRTAKSSNV